MGGEPTLYYGFRNLIKRINSLGFNNISILSNGNSLDDVELVSFLLENNVKKFILAFHDIDKKSYETQTGNKLAINRVVAAIDNILSLGGAIIVNNVVNTSNYKRLDDIYEFLYDIGIREYAISHVVPPTQLKYNFEDLFPGYFELYPYLEKGLDFLNKKNAFYFLQYFPYCILNSYKDRRLNSYKNKAYSVTENGYEGFHYDCTRNFSIKRVECKSCKYDKSCIGVFKDYIAKKGWNEFIPITHVDFGDTKWLI